MNFENFLKDYQRLTPTFLKLCLNYMPQYKKALFFTYTTSVVLIAHICWNSVYYYAIILIPLIIIIFLIKIIDSNPKNIDEMKEFNIKIKEERDKVVLKLLEENNINLYEKQKIEYIIKKAKEYKSQNSLIEIFKFHKIIVGTIMTFFLPKFHAIVLRIPETFFFIFFLFFIIIISSIYIFYEIYKIFFSTKDELCTNLIDSLEYILYFK